MKILLVSPEAAFLAKNQLLSDFWNKTDGHLSSVGSWWKGYNPSILLIAGLTPEDNDIEVVDENYQKINFNKEYDLVGISIMTQQATRGYEIADIFLQKGTNVVIGGIHATILPNEAKEHATSIVIGEAENIWEKVIEDCSYNKLKSFYKSDLKVNLNRTVSQQFKYIPKDYTDLFCIQSTRGCPHDCEFCAASKLFGKEYRKKEVKYVIDEIKEVLNHFEKPRILFSDDNMFVDKKRSELLLKELIKLKLPAWHAQTDINIAFQDDLLDLLFKAGCTNILIGFESLTPVGLKQIDKRGFKLKNLNNYSKAIQNIQSHGVSVTAAFIIGLDHEGKEAIQRTIDFIIENNIATIQATILTPYPGTRLRERIINENRLLDTNWDNYTCFDVNINHPTMSKEELENGIFSIYKNINSIDVYERKINYFKKIYADLYQKDKS